MNSKLLTLLLLLGVSHLKCSRGPARRNRGTQRHSGPAPAGQRRVGAGHKTTQKKGELTVRALVLEQDGTLVVLSARTSSGFPRRWATRSAPP